MENKEDVTRFQSHIWQQWCPKPAPCEQESSKLSSVVLTTQHFVLNRCNFSSEYLHKILHMCTKMNIFSDERIHFAKKRFF